MQMKILTLMIAFFCVGYSRAIPTWGLSLGPPRGPGWSDNAAAAAATGGLYPAIGNPYGSYGYAPGSSPTVYVGSYSQSPTFPGYTPGLYGLGYLNLRG